MNDSKVFFWDLISSVGPVILTAHRIGEQHGRDALTGSIRGHSRCHRD